MALAKKLGISKTPVREALLELSNQGLVTFLPRKGLVVNHFSRRDVEEIFELRWVIELYAIQKVAKSAKSYDLTPIENSLHAQRKAIGHKDTMGYLKANAIFHRTFSELTNNRRFLEIYKNISDMIRLMSLQAALADRMAETIAEHEKILTAVRQENPHKARKAIEYHLRQFRTAVLDGFNRKYA